MPGYSLPYEKVSPHSFTKGLYAGKTVIRLLSNVNRKFTFLQFF